MITKKQFSIGILLTLMVLSGCSSQNKDDTNIMSDDITTTDITTEVEKTEKRADVIEKLTIEVVLPDGETGETRSGNTSNIDLNRPSTLKWSEVFDGWSQEELVSKIMNGSAIKDNEITLTAESIDIGNCDNVIYNDVTYVNSCMDSISIPITIGGNTNFAILELEISYDTSLLEFESFISKDTDVECNCPEPGLICISFVSTDNVSADIELCNIQFKNISKEGAETSLKYNIKDLVAWNLDKTDYIDVNHEVINSRIVMF